MKTAATILIACVGALLALSFVMLYSCSLGGDGARFLISQMKWCAIGIVPCALAASIDYRKLRALAWLPYLLAILLLVLVLIPPFGVQVKGAYRWIRFGSFGFQPSELAKIAIVLLMAAYCDQHQRHIRSWKHGVIVPIVILAPALALIYKEPDKGTTILLAGVSVVMLLIAGAKLRYIALPGVAGAFAFSVALLNDPVRSSRIASWIDIEAHKDKTGYQAWQSMVALGSGGWFGLGLGNSARKLGLLPDRHTDFILAIIGEELGVVASLLVLAAFIAIFLAGIYIVCKASDFFGRILAAGITFLIGFQAFINIGVVTSFLPTKGLPLPFVSYGGSSLLIMLTCLGVLLSVAIHSKAIEPLSSRADDEQDFISDNPFSAGPNPEST